MEEGKILDENMKKLKFTMDDLNQHLRELGVFDINEVEYALLEVSGVLSIKKKNRFLPLTKTDMNMNPSPSLSIPIELIMEGKVTAMAPCSSTFLKIISQVTMNEWTDKGI
jgi:uncharacterized membrane protein YcaP (DUF421 family)